MKIEKHVEFQIKWSGINVITYIIWLNRHIIEIFLKKGKAQGDFLWIGLPIAIIGLGLM